MTDRKNRIIPIIAILLMTAALFCGCSKKQEIEPRTAGFSCKAQVHCSGTEFTCDLMIGENGTASAKITEPSSLKGLSCSYNGDKMTLSYLGIKKEIDPSQYTEFGYFSEVRRILLSVPENAEAAVKNGAYTYEGECSAGSYTIEFRADGFPVKVTLPSEDLTVTFSDFEYYNAASAN